MPQYLSYRYALRLKPAQERTLRRWAGQMRWVWNRALAEQKARHTRGEKYANYFEMAKWLTAWRADPALAWLAEGPVQAQQQVLIRLHRAYLQFFKGTFNHPKGKKRGREPALRFPDPSKAPFDAVGSRLRLPKIGWVGVRLSRPVTGTIRSVTVSRDVDRWYVSFEVQVDGVLPAGEVQPTLGIDLGIAVFAATCDAEGYSELHAPTNARRRHQARLRRYQRMHARRKTGSKNRKKALDRLRRLHQRIRLQRHAFLDELSTRLANSHPVIAIEELRVAAMSAQPRREPGRRRGGVSAKAGLNMSIRDQGWAEFAVLLDYKLRARGGALVRVPSAYTSQTCSSCGHVAAESRTGRDTFACTACGSVHHADANAAAIILARGQEAWAQLHSAAGERPAAGHAVAACGGLIRRKRRVRGVDAGPVKQEPTEAVRSPRAHARQEAPARVGVETKT